jgi:hypothetical protein
MRLAIEVGLEDLRRIDYNLASVIVDSAALTKSPALRGRKSQGLKELEVPLQEYAANLLSPQIENVAEDGQSHPIANARRKKVSYRNTRRSKKPE